MEQTAPYQSVQLVINITNAIFRAPVQTESELQLHLSDISVSLLH